MSAVFLHAAQGVDVVSVLTQQVWAESKDNLQTAHDRLLLLTQRPSDLAEVRRGVTVLSPRSDTGETPTVQEERPNVRHSRRCNNDEGSC